MAQAEARAIAPALEAPVLAPEVVAHAMQSYLLKKAPPLPPPDAKSWAEHAGKLRREFLDRIVFNGWPREWVNSAPKFEDLGLVAGTKGYRLRRLRYEIVPGMWGAALLYEPEKLTGKVPAVLNVNGHVGPPGKSVEYKQKRCIMQARMGMLALNLEWIYFGELQHPQNAHWMASHLDLAGASGVGLFYLAMRRGLDYLWEHPNADRTRTAVTGLSGGGWQTIVLSALDERVKVSIPVAGYSDFVARVERREDIGDIEQNATDMLTVADYSHLTAMRAPRPTLLVYNAEDDCCFKAPLVKDGIYTNVRPFFAMSGAGANFAWHENFDPGDHNYQLDNRLASYRFLAQHFGLTSPAAEPPDVAAEVKSYEELVVGLPPDNLTLVGLARKLHAPAAAGDRNQLARLVRYSPVTLAHAWPVTSTRGRGVETRGLRFEFSNGLPAAAGWASALESPAEAPATILMDYRGRKALAEAAAGRVNRGELVLALDPLFIGGADTGRTQPYMFVEMLAAAGDRALGIQAAQLIAAARWLSSKKPVRVESHGIQTQMIALVAAALEPSVFSEVVVRDGVRSLREVFDKALEYEKAPEIFCHSLARHFDVGRLQELKNAR
jgi:hypothetical protein